MKHLFLVFVSLFATLFVSKAQSVQVATLSHDGTITSYTGTDGFKNAYQNAVDGDVITLSAGSFSVPNIEKRITIRGAGMGVKVNDSDPYIEPTYLFGSFSIIADGSSENRLKLEGIVSEGATVSLCGVSNALFSKCKFEKLDYSTNKGGFTNVTFINCVLSGSLCYNMTSNMYGCYLKDLYARSSGSLHNMTNCIIETTTSSGNYDNCVIKNSIYLNSYKSQGNLAQSYHSIWSGICPTNTDFYKSLEAHNNSIVPDEMSLFKEGTFYQLTDEAKQFLGSDGTEVGIYGGSIPFDPTPTNPQITRFNVAPKTTADGKLSVDIEVNTK